MMTHSAIQSLYLKDFRNYKETCIPFSPGVNCIVGANAQGKTNLLEAIHLLVTGRSFRTTNLTDLIRFGAKSFYLRAEFTKNRVAQTLTLTYDGQIRKIIHNTTLLPTTSALLGLLVGVVFSPEDRRLIRGGPIYRREFLDIQNAISSPLYLHHLSRYKRALKHRNALLRQKTPHTLAIWEEQMAHSAAFLVLQRKASIEILQEKAAPLQKLLGDPQETLIIKYKSKAPLESDNLTEEHLASLYQKGWAHNREKELLLGQTLTGPHKDDLTLLINTKEARHFGSEGQVRSVISALRFASVEHLRERTKQMPLVCIDDIAISLDQKRLKCLAHHVHSLGQVFITTPEKDLPLAQADYIQISEGQYC